MNFNDKRILGYNYLKSTNNFEIIYKLKDDLAKIDLTKIKNNYIEFDFSLSLKQYYLNAFGTRRLESLICYYFGNNKKTIWYYPIPIEFSEPFIKNKININVYFCNLFFKIISLALFLKSISNFFLYIFLSLKKKQNLEQEYFYFSSLKVNNFPRKDKNNYYDVITWFTNFFKTNNIKIAHDSLDFFDTNKVNTHRYIYLKYPFLLNYTYYDYFKIFWTTLKSSFNFNIWNLFFFDEVVRYIFFYNSSPKNYAGKYLYPASSRFYRPIWTYLADHKFEIDVIYYFYSTYDDIFIKNQSYFKNDYSALLSWSKIFFWDHYQQKRFNEIIKRKFHSFVVGPISFTSSNKSLQHYQDFICVFDIEPFSLNSNLIISNYCLLNLDQVDYHIKFINDIIDVSKSFGLKIVLKPKRLRFDSGFDHRYIDFIKWQEKSGNIIIIDSDFSPFEVISNAKYVVSYPITSTDSIAAYLGVKSTIYDHTGKVDSNDPALRQTELVSSKLELHKFLKS